MCNSWQVTREGYIVSEVTDSGVNGCDCKRLLISLGSEVRKVWLKYVEATGIPANK